MAPRGNCREGRVEGLKLKVEEGFPKDIGKGRVRIHKETFWKLDTNPGNIVIIEKNRKGTGVVWHAPPGSD